MINNMIIPGRVIKIRSPKKGTTVHLLKLGFKLKKNKGSVSEFSFSIPEDAIIEGTVSDEETRYEIFPTDESIGGDDDKDWTVLIIENKFSDRTEVFFAY